MMHKARWLAITLVFLGGAACNLSLEEDPEITVALKGMPLTLVPHVEAEIISNSVQNNLFEGLVGFDADMRITPLLAVSWENPDDQTWLFKLRPGVLFHDGAPLRAGDVVYSLDRAKNHPASAIKSSFVNIEAVAPVNDQTIRIRTRRPDPILLNKLNLALVIPKAYLEKVGEEEFYRRPVGTGPYALESIVPGRQLILRRWDRYWGERPEMARQTIVALPPEEAIQDFLSGRVDIVAEMTPEQAREVERQAPKEMAIVRRPGLALRYLGMNTTVKPLSDVRVRRAISLAVDRRQLVDKMLLGYGSTSNQLIPHGVFGYHPGLPELAYDPATARRLLAEAGFPGGVDLTLVLPQLRLTLGQELQRQMEPAMIRLKLQALPRETFFARVDEVPFFLLGSVNVSGDASDVFDDFIHSPGDGYGRVNGGRYFNLEADRRIEAMSSLLNPRQRLAALQDVMALVMEDVPRVPLYVEDEIYGVAKRLSWKTRLDLMVLGKDVRQARP